MMIRFGPTIKLLAFAIAMLCCFPHLSSGYSIILLALACMTVFIFYFVAMLSSLFLTLSLSLLYKSEPRMEIKNNGN